MRPIRWWAGLAVGVLAACPPSGTTPTDSTNPECDGRFFSEGFRLTPPERCAVVSVALAGEGCGETFNGGQYSAFVWVMAAREGPCSVTVTFKDGSTYTAQTTFTHVNDPNCGAYFKGSGHQRIPAASCPGCTTKASCAMGEYCRLDQPADTCSNPLTAGPMDRVCGKCGGTGGAIVGCADDPSGGEPCDPEEVPSGYVCRRSTCVSETMKTCRCDESGFWDCGSDSRDFLNPNADAGTPSCGTAPLCWANCNAPPPGADAGN